MASESPTPATMMGLGAGLDYSLVLTTHYRHLLHTTNDPCAAAGEALASGGRVLLVAAAAVALAGLCVSGVGFLTTLGVAAGVTVLVASLATLSLAPALFGLLGRRIDRPTSAGRPTRGSEPLTSGTAAPGPWAIAPGGFPAVGVCEANWCFLHGR
ncbi:MMPL family transporter [Streptomyces lavendulae]|uniref:MMPL family transporter n=1 Tax=Streptomyces lavendulae TaxID=1914 RepID=UPI0033EB703A